MEAEEINHKFTFITVLSGHSVKFMGAGYFHTECSKMLILILKSLSITHHLSTYGPSHVLAHNLFLYYMSQREKYQISNLSPLE